LAEQDRRRNLVTLTPSGTAALKRLDKRVEAAQSALLKPLSATDRRELVRLLEQLVDHDRMRVSGPTTQPPASTIALRRGRREPRGHA
jgi:hypothetical protein